LISSRLLTLAQCPSGGSSALRDLSSVESRQPDQRDRTDPVRWECNRDLSDSNPNLHSSTTVSVLASTLILIDLRNPKSADSGSPHSPVAISAVVKAFQSFDGATISYHDQGEGFPVILLHGYGVDSLGQFGSFERILSVLEARQQLFIETFGKAPGASAHRQNLARQGSIPTGPWHVTWSLWSSIFASTQWT
jgi:hypothetical protein